MKWNKVKKEKEQNKKLERKQKHVYDNTSKFLNRNSRKSNCRMNIMVVCCVESGRWIWVEKKGDGILKKITRFIDIWDQKQLRQGIKKQSDSNLTFLVRLLLSDVLCWYFVFEAAILRFLTSEQKKRIVRELRTEVFMCLQKQWENLEKETELNIRR